ncbi:hypothetical protein PM082_010035 [Marasmius tenuissimus]|nr:hypothetical protein PM082_010035 [Marasmius tenuissimus]
MCRNQSRACVETQILAVAFTKHENEHENTSPRLYGIPPLPIHYDPYCTRQTFTNFAGSDFAFPKSAGLVPNISRQHRHCSVETTALPPYDTLSTSGLPKTYLFRHIHTSPRNTLHFPLSDAAL